MLTFLATTGFVCRLPFLFLLFLAGALVLYALVSRVLPVEVRETAAVNLLFLIFTHILIMLCSV